MVKKKEEKEKIVETEEETSKETKKPVKEKKDEPLKESELEETVDDEITQEVEEIIDEQMFTEFMRSSGVRISSSLDQVALTTPTRIRIESGPNLSREDEDEEIKYAMTPAGGQDTKYMSTATGEKFYSENDQRIDYSPDTGNLVRDTTTSNFQRDSFQSQERIDPLTAMGIQRREDINMSFTQPGLWGIKKKRPGEKDEDRRYITK